MRIRKSRSELRVDVQMTPMIDVVFQLLAFFIVSFRVVAPEGDLLAKMPAHAIPDAPRTETFDVPLDVHLLADAQGDLASIELNNGRLAGLEELQAQVERLTTENADLQVNLICDEHLHYQYAVAALTACSGKRQGDDVRPLARDVRLLSPK